VIGDVVAAQTQPGTRAGHAIARLIGGQDLQGLSEQQSGVGVGRAAKAGVLGQDVGVELAKGRARIDAELLGERPGRPPVRRQRVGLPVAAVERQHQKTPQPFAQRLVGHETLERRHRLPLFAHPQARIPSVLERGHPQPVEARSFVRREANPARGELLVRGSPPQPLSVGQADRGRLGVTGPKAGPTQPYQFLESACVNGFGVSPQQVSVH
jgi:hypothetical protein